MTCLGVNESLSVGHLFYCGANLPVTVATPEPDNGNNRKGER